MSDVQKRLEYVESAFDFISQELLTQLENNLKVVASNIESQVAPLFLTGFSLYVLLIALNWLRGGIDDNFLETIKSWLGWLLTIAVAFNASNYIALTQAVYSLPDDFIPILSGSSGTSMGFSQIAKSIQEIHQQVESHTDELGRFDLSKIVFYVFSGFIEVAAVLIIGLALVFYLLAKILLLCVLIVGPIFLGFLLYPSTRQWGMNWIGQVMSYTVNILLISVASELVIRVCISLFDFVNTKMSSMGMSLIGLMAFTAILLVGAILFFAILLNLPNISSALTGGASAQMNHRAISRMASMIGKPFAKAASKGGEYAGKGWGMLRNFNSMRGK